jgi:hypothetical protein
MNNFKNIYTYEGLKETRVYGSDEIKKLYAQLGDQEYVHLDDTSGTLSGEKVTKNEYVMRMLKRAQESKDWSLVQQTIRFIETQMK